MYVGKKEKRYQIISDILKITVAANDTNNGKIVIFNEQSRDLFHFSEADRISFAESNKINAMAASTPYSGSPVGVVIDIIPAAVEDIVLVVVVIIVLVSMISTHIIEVLDAIKTLLNNLISI